MDFILASALLLSDASKLPNASEHASEQSAFTQTEKIIETSGFLVQPTSQQISQNEPVCAPGQFLSVFPDVYPTDWAYQAVNRLSSRSAACFDLPAPGEEIR